MARDAVTVVPVQAAEISRVLARRLFDRIDQQAARETANAYMDMYSKSSLVGSLAPHVRNFTLTVVPP